MPSKAAALAALETLRESLSADADTYARARREAIRALEAVGLSENDWLVEAAVNECQRGRTDARSLAGCSAVCQVLAKRQEPRAVPMIGGILADERVTGIREDLVEYLGEIGDAAAVPYLVAAFADRNEWVRAKAAESLSYIGDRGAIDALVGRLSDDSSTVREYVVHALTALRALEAKPKLLDMLEHEQDVEVRRHVARSLGVLGVKEAAPLLRAIVAEDADEDLVLEATNALRALGEE